MEIYFVVPIAIFMLYILTENPGFYMKKNRIYWNSTSVSVANIYGIEPRLGQSSNGKLEGHTVKRYVALETEKDNQMVAQILKKPEVLADKPMSIIVDSLNDTDGEVNDFLKGIEIDEEFGSQIEKVSFYPRLHRNDRNQKMLLATGSFLIVPSLLIMLEVYRINRNKKAYPPLFAEYPELEDNLELITT